MKKFKNNQGQNMLEMVFAIGILMIAVAAIVALTTANVIGQKESEDQIIANNLAREGIEVVRNIRDSNWLGQVAWDQGLTGDGTAIPVHDKTDNSWQLNFTPDDFSSVAARVYFDGDTFNQSAAGQATPYYRILNLSEICLNISGIDIGKEEILSPGQTCSAATQRKSGIKIEALIYWIARNTPRNLNMEDLIYSWK